MWGLRITASLMHSCHVMESLISRCAYLGINANTKRFTEQNSIIMELYRPAVVYYFLEMSSHAIHLGGMSFVDVCVRVPRGLFKGIQVIIHWCLWDHQEGLVLCLWWAGVILLLCMDNESQSVSFGLRA